MAKNKSKFFILWILGIVLIVFALIRRKKVDEKIFYYISMGTIVEIHSPSKELADSAFSVVKKLDSLLDPRKENSDLTKINKNSGKWVKVSKETIECIKKAIEVAKLTQGNFDPTIYPVLKLWRFHKEKNWKIPPKDSLKKYLKFVDWKKIKIKKDSVKIMKNQALDLGGIAKGFASQKAIEKLKKLGVKNALVNIGGDLTTIGKPYKIGIQNPRKKGIIKIIKVKNKTVCTSGDYQRFIKSKGKIYYHIINPKTGFSKKSQFISITVIGEDGALVDGLATAFFLLNKKDIIKLLKKLHYKAILIDTNLSIYFYP